jgi:hypothetical protein
LWISPTARPASRQRRFASRQLIEQRRGVFAAPEIEVALRQWQLEAARVWGFRRQLLKQGQSQRGPRRAGIDLRQIVVRLAHGHIEGLRLILAGPHRGRLVEDLA